MTNTVLLDTIAHADLRVAIGYSALFGDAVNECVLFPGEIDEAQRDYPILFRRDDAGTFYAVALLGLDRDENLFLDITGWQARHIPVIHQRGPFLIGLVDRTVDGQRGEADLIDRQPVRRLRLKAVNVQPVLQGGDRRPHGGRADLP